MQRVELMQALGRVPCLPRLRDEIGFELIADLFLDVIERHNLPAEIEDDFLGALKDERVGAQRPTRRVFFASAN